MNICHSPQALHFCMRSLCLRDKTEEENRRHSQHAVKIKGSCF